MDALDRIEKQSGRTVAKLQGDFKRVGVSIGAALGGALSVGAIARSFGAALDEMAALDDAAQSTGASVESLSSLLNTLAPTGVSLAQITDAAGKLTKAMAGADEETSKAAAAFKAIGVATKDAAGNLRPVDDVLVDVAKSLAGYADGTNKVAIAQAIFGRTGADLLPMLKDLAEFQRQGASVTAEQAKAASDLADEWGKLGVQAGILRTKIASELIPELAKLLTQFNLTGAAGGSFWERIRGALGPNKFIAELESDIADLQTRRDALASDTRPLMQAGKVEGLAELDRQIADIQARIKRIRPAQGVANGPTLAELLAQQTPEPKPQAPGGLGGDDEKRRKALEDAAKAYRELDAIIAQADIDDELKRQAQAQEDAARALRAYVDELARAEGINAESLGKALAPDMEGWQRVADLLREIRGIDPASNAINASLDVANELLNTGVITFDEYEKLGSKILDLKDPIAEVAEASKSMFAPIESALEAAILDMEDLGDVAKALVRDIAQVMLRQQITGPLGDFLGKSFGGGSGTTLFDMGRKLLGFADGGYPPIGVPSLVGERGPELIVPRSPMAVIPNGRFGGGAITINQTISYGSTDRAGAAQFAARVQADTMRTLREAQVRGAA